MTKEQRIEKYIFEFFSDRYEDIDCFFWSSHRNRHYEVYPLKNGTKIMDFIISIHGNVEESFYGERLIPQKFATTESLLKALHNFKEYLLSQQHLLDENDTGEDTWYAVTKTASISKELVEMINHVTQLYDIDHDTMPYQDLRYYLVSKNIPDFITSLKSIFASVSYAISKNSEGHYHSNVHIILKLLGFEVLSEELTNRGRIDAVIRFTNIVFILEFKFGDADESAKAIQQIIKKGYAEKFFIERKEIIAIGISFSNQDRNINGYQWEIIRSY